MPRALDDQVSVDCVETNAYPLPLKVEGTVASITIKLDDALERCLRVRAAEHGRSVEEEVCEILGQVVGHLSGSVNLGQSIQGRFASLAENVLPVPERAPMRAAPAFD